MKKLISLLALICCSSLWAQCPEWAVKATVKVNDWHGDRASSGTGTIVEYDLENKTCLVMTCRHVVELEHGKIEVVTWNNKRLPAKFIGVHELSTRGADITILEISSEHVTDWVPISTQALGKGDKICQVGWGGGRLNQRLGQCLGISGYSNGGWRLHWNTMASFPAISGDSGSGIFSIDRKELVGVLWGGGGGTSLFCGPEYCAQAIELCRKRQGRCPGGKCPGGGGGGVPVQPGQPPVPKFPETPSPPAEAKPSAEMKQVADSLVKLTDVTGKLADNVGGLNARVATMEDRLAAAEKARCGCSGAGSAGVPPPSASPAKDYGPELAKVQDDLARLRQSLKASGTLRFNIDPKK